MPSSIWMDFNIEAWERQINAEAAKITTNYRVKVEKSAYVLLEKIKEYTPVGNPNLWNPPYWPKNYVPGTLKASWEIEIGTDAVTISNPQPYAYRVEYGWSKQAPEGMMRRAVAEYPFLIDSIK